MSESFKEEEDTAERFRFAAELGASAEGNLYAEVTVGECTITETELHSLVEAWLVAEAAGRFKETQGCFFFLVPFVLIVCRDSFTCSSLHVQT